MATMVDPDGEDDTPDVTEEQRNLTDTIDELLADNRPERYDRGERGWQDPVIAKVADVLRQSPTETVEDLACRRVHAREGEASRKLRRVLRQIFDNEQLPLGWGEGEDWKQLYYDVLRLPLTIGKQRVQFGSATEADWDQWIAEDQEQADQRAATDQHTNNGGRLIVQWIRDQRAGRTDNLRQQDGLDH